MGKLNNLSSEVRERVDFKGGNYVELLNNIDESFYAAIFMGNAYPHMVENYKKVLKAVSDRLSKNGILFFQINNFHRLFNVRKRFLSLNFSKAKAGISHEFAFLEFYDPKREDNKNFSLNMAVFDFNGKNWRLRSMNSTPILDLDKEKMKKLLNKVGFRKMEIFGADANGSLLESFDKDKSYYLNILAKR
ncbi:MAG: class I SAM-dependent methyltransferase [Candidatus Levybacteria bacterium]|nr:class I SAM-dependent methyltransferase [Candidatus Levybacteria bacterium]